MPRFERHFTLAEARAELPALRRQLIKANDLVAEIRKRETEESLGSGPLIRQNGRGPIVSGGSAQREAAQEILNAIADSGIYIKDLAQGLVDFPHFLDGDADHEVFLCWRLGEDTIEYWHEIDDGFAGRVRIE